MSNKCLKEKTTLLTKFDSLLKQQPNKIAVHFEEQKWTYSEMAKFSNKIARFFKSQGLQKGDVVALLLDNCVEYPCIYLGLSRLGVVSALINTNLMKSSLLHTITVTKSKAIIFDTTHGKTIEDIADDIKELKLYHWTEGEQGNNDIKIAVNLTQKLEQVEDTPILDALPEISHNDPLIYIFTSGTTGLPKASVLSHTRYVIIACGISIAIGIGRSDILYTPLSFYHSAGGVCGLGQALVNGTTIVIKKKFSASSYFKDCAKYNATVGHYIGEMCRYIPAASVGKEPEKHKVRTMFGNGIGKFVWKKLITKYNINNVIELYGSTEGVAVLLNLNNTIGSVGYVPSFLKVLDLMILIKCDEHGDPIRDKNGVCIKCGINEPGLILGKINPNHAVFNYKGYTDNTATEKKILYNVLTKGDMYFNSGDILVYDEYGYFYFKDRMGDTFRWKAENISTCEVEIIISNLINLNEVIVYGVQVPNTEGRAGMAAIVDPNQTVNIKSLGDALKLNLPSYAIPVFIRILDSPPLTDTYKLKKGELREEAYNINIIKDKLFFFDPNTKSYITFHKELYDDIINSRIRL